MSLIVVNTRKLAMSIADAVPNRPDVQRVIRGIGQAALQYWKKLAQEELKSTARDYIAGLAVTYASDVVRIDLVGVLPNMIEHGWRGGDMREWMLKSPRAKQGKHGPYLVVPFRHGTPKSSGRNVGRPMPASIHAAAKLLAPTVSRPRIGGLYHEIGKKHTVYGDRLKPTSRGVKEDARKILTSKEKPWHTTSIFTGMIRKEKLYEKKKQSHYTTFRTISQHTNDPERHWIHPGIRAKRFAPRVQQHVSKMATAILRVALTSTTPNRGGGQ